MIFYLILAIISGFCMAFQSPTNATLSRYIGNLQATCVSFGGGAICLAILMIFIGTGDLSNVAETSWWELLGGVYGVCIVLAITFAMPRLGAALTSTILMLGQISMGAVIDTFGLMQMEALPLAPGRVAGCFLVLIGIILVYKGKKQQEADKTYNRQTIVVAVCTFLAGISGAIQSPTNTALAEHVGKLEASFISFITGFAFILVITLIATKGHLLTGKKEGIEWWMLIGGTYGAAVVFINIVSIPHLGAAVLLIATMLGQLSGGTLVDSFGLLRASKIKMNTWRCVGILIIAIGVIFVAMAKM
ncbi:MAG: DMT family transporter [Bacillota bacterium]|nr:DMT family transporter [Bacillota bacterium]